MSVDHFSYRVIWSAEDGEFLGLCAEFPSLSWLDRSPEDALAGIRRLIAEVVPDLVDSAEQAPASIDRRAGRRP